MSDRLQGLKTMTIKMTTYNYNVYLSLVLLKTCCLRGRTSLTQTARQFVFKTKDKRSIFLLSCLGREMTTVSSLVCGLPALVKSAAEMAADLVWIQIESVSQAIDRNDSLYAFLILASAYMVHLNSANFTQSFFRSSRIK